MSTQPRNRPVIKYRVELEKRLEINKSYSERRNQAAALRILSYAIFGQKRYQNIYLCCSLNCFYWALKIANNIYRKVPGLAMVIKFEQVHVIEYYAEAFQGKTYGEKRYTKFLIKLTKTPTDDDKKEPGFNAGLSAQSIKQPLTEVISRVNADRPGYQRSDRNRGRGGYRNNNKQGGYRRRQENNDRPKRRYDADQRYDRERNTKKYLDKNEGRRQQSRYRGEGKREGRYREESRRGQTRNEGRRQNNKTDRYEDERNYKRGEKRERGRNNYQHQNYEERREKKEDRGERRPRRRRYSSDSD